jgi:hypothetical protein
MELERKIHSNSLLKNLPAEKQAEIIFHIDGLGGNNYVETAAWLNKDNILATPQMVSDFHRWYVMVHEFWENAEFALEMTAVCMKNGWVKNAREERAAAQTFFNRCVVAKRDPKLWSMVERVNLVKDKVDLEEKKLKLAARKLKAKSAAGKEPDGTRMSSEEKEAAIRRIYGMS